MSSPNFSYEIAARPTMYKGVRFRSRLEARWAAFFDISDGVARDANRNYYQTKVEWEYEPLDLKNWVPDFLLKVTCRHTECIGMHYFLCEVKPYSDARQFESHECTQYHYSRHRSNADAPLPFLCDCGVGLGLNPSVVYSGDFSHGAGGSDFKIDDWLYGPRGESADARWATAGNLTQYQRSPP